MIIAFAAATIPPKYIYLAVKIVICVAHQILSKSFV